MPKEFHIQINATFFAEDIMDAFDQLGNHFKAESQGEDSTLDMLGDIGIHPTSDCDEAHEVGAQENDES